MAKLFNKVFCWYPVVIMGKDNLMGNNLMFFKKYTIQQSKKIYKQIASQLKMLASYAITQVLSYSSSQNTTDPNLEQYEQHQFFNLANFPNIEINHYQNYTLILLDTRGSQVYVDADFYQSIKQLLQQVGFYKWEPCLAIDRSKIIQLVMRRTRKKWWGFFLAHNLCHFYEVMRDRSSQRSVYGNHNHVFQQNGIQAATLSLFYPPNLQSQLLNKISKVGLSFVQQFVVLQDHLHSASSIYVPLNEYFVIPLKGLIIPGVCFFIASAAFLITKAVYLMDKVQIQVKKQEIQETLPSYTFLIDSLTLSGKQQLNPVILLLILVLYCSTVQYYLNKTIIYSLIIGLIVRFTISNNLEHRQKELIRIIIAGFNIFICQYFMIFCFPLSLISIICTDLICFLNKCWCLVVIGIFIVCLGYFGDLSLVEIVMDGGQISVIGQIVFYPLFLWVFVI